MNIINKDKLEARVKELEYIINSLNLPKHCNILFPAKEVKKNESALRK